MNKAWFGHFLAIFTVIQWGLTYVSSKYLLSDFTPTELLFDRFSIGLVLLFAIKPKFYGLRPLSHELRFALAGFFGVVLYFSFENTALIYTRSSNVAVIVTSAPLFVAIVNRFLGDKHKLSLEFIVGFIVAMAGICMIHFGQGELRLNPLGDFLALCGAMSWGFYTLFLRQLYNLGYKSMEITRSVFAYALVLTVPMMLVSDYSINLKSALKPYNLMNLAFLSLIATAICFIAWNRATKLIGAVKCSSYIYATSVITCLAASWFLDEAMSFKMLIGIVLTIVGLIISEHGSILLAPLLKALKKAQIKPKSMDKWD